MLFHVYDDDDDDGYAGAYDVGDAYSESGYMPDDDDDDDDDDKR